MAYLYINAFFNFVIMTLNMIITKLMNNIGYYEINESVLYDIFYQMIDFNSDEDSEISISEEDDNDLTKMKKIKSFKPYS